jgi:hypothetical protein
MMMMTTVLLIAALVWGAVLIVVGLIAALRKPDKAEAEKIQRLAEQMSKASRDDPDEPARFVP